MTCACKMYDDDDSDSDSENFVGTMSVLDEGKCNQGDNQGDMDQLLDSRAENEVIRDASKGKSPDDMCLQNVRRR